MKDYTTKVVVKVAKGASIQSLLTLAKKYMLEQEKYFPARDSQRWEWFCLGTYPDRVEYKGTILNLVGEK